jgi:hypothetical protein
VPADQDEPHVSTTELCNDLVNDDEAPITNRAETIPVALITVSKSGWLDDIGERRDRFDEFWIALDVEYGLLQLIVDVIDRFEGVVGRFQG